MPYNSQVELVEELEKRRYQGNKAGFHKRNRQARRITSKLMELYMQGYESAMSRMEEIREYMKNIAGRILRMIYVRIKKSLL